MKIYNIFLCFIGLLSQSCLKEEVVFNTPVSSKLELVTILKFNGKDCFYSAESNTLRFPVETSTVNDFAPLVDFQSYSNVYFDDKPLKNGQINSLGKIDVGKEYIIRVETRGTSKSIVLSFTTLPMVQIITPNTIADEPKTMAKIVVNYVEAEKMTDQYFVGIEFRGGTSQLNDKKSFGFSLKGSINLNNDISGSFFNLKPSNDWILDAMWIDRSRLRNKTSFELWKKMNPSKNIGIESRLVELYVNNEWQGIYSLNENINAEFLNIEATNAVLYKASEWEDGATRFERYADNAPISSYWDGWEQTYPDPKVEIKWTPLNDFRELIVNGTNEVFKEQIDSRIDIDNLVDYYIFLNLTSAADNTGKNTFLYQGNSNEKFKIIPWDLDGTWGLVWDGSEMSSQLILSNNLFDRLIQLNVSDFKNKLKERWNNLRTTAFLKNELENVFKKHFETINESQAIALENSKWDINIDVEVEKVFLLTWLENRLFFLDNYFDNL